MIHSREIFTQETLSQIFETLVRQEVELVCSPEVPEARGTKYLPEITSGGLTWYQFAEEVYRQKGIVNILDLGTGYDAGAWTGGRNGHNLNTQVKQLKEREVNLIVTAQSATGGKDWVQAHGVDRFMTGHFMEVLKQLETEGKKFDIVLSRFSLYRTFSVYSILDYIDRILFQNGRAFLEEVYIGPGSTNALVFLPGFAPQNGLLNNFYFTTPGFILPPDQSLAGGLTYTMNAEGWHTGFKKGDLDKHRLPKFVGTATQINGIMPGHWYALFEAQFPKS